MNKTILVIGGGILQVPLVEEAQKMNFDVIVSDLDAACPCRELADRFWEIDVFNSTEHVEHARTLLVQESVQLVGAIAAGIDAIETAWKVNNWIKLQTKGKHGFWAGYKATMICRTKSGLRGQQMKLKLNYPQYGWTKYPFIIKPQDSSGGRGITKVYDEIPLDEFQSLIRRAKSYSPTKSFIVEELLTGTEHTVETIWENGKMYPAFITDRYFKNNDKYAIEAGASHPSTLSTVTQGEIYSVMESLGNSLGLKYGPLKGDILIDKKNKIYILEATTRYSGGFDCQYLVPMATGKNNLRAAIQSNVYGKFYKGLLKAKWDKHTMIGSPWPNEGIMKGYDLSLPLTDGDYRAFYIAKKGDKIKYVDSTSRVAFLIVTADSHTQAIERMKKGLENLRVETE